MRFYYVCHIIVNHDAISHYIDGSSHPPSPYVRHLLCLEERSDRWHQGCWKSWSDQDKRHAFFTPLQHINYPSFPIQPTHFPSQTTNHRTISFQNQTKPNQTTRLNFFANTTWILSSESSQTRQLDLGPSSINSLGQEHRQPRSREPPRYLSRGQEGGQQRYLILLSLKSISN